MTQIEKLKELLREAQKVTQDSLESNKISDDEPDCLCNACERYRSLIARIENALNTPNMPDGYGHCEFCKGAGVAPKKKAWSPQEVLEGL